MPWVYVLIGSVLEIVWAISMKSSAGFTRPLPSVLTVLAVTGSLYFLSLGLKTLPVGSAYAVWTGLGAMGTAILGMWLFGEPRDPIRLLSIALIVIGVLGLRGYRVESPSPPTQEETVKRSIPSNE